MIVEIEDFKVVNTKNDKGPGKAPIARALLCSNSETLFADLCLLNQKNGNKWTDKDALQAKAEILVRSFHRLLGARSHSLLIARYIITSIPSIQSFFSVKIGKQKLSVVESLFQSNDSAERAMNSVLSLLIGASLELSV